MSQFIGSFAADGGASTLIVSTYDIYDRSRHMELFKTVPKHGALTWMRGNADRMGKRRVERNEYYYYEEQQHFKAACTIAAATADGSNVNITLAAGDHQKSGKYSWPVARQECVFADETVGYVYDVDKSSDNAHVIKIKPANASQDVNAAAVVGSTVVFFSNAQPERSSSTTARLPQFKKVTNYIQTFREKFEVTDHEEQQKIEFTVDGVSAFSYKGLNDTMDNFKLQEDLGLLLGVASSTLTTKDSEPVRLVSGLINQIDTSGKTLEYFGSPDMTTIDDVMMILNKNFGDTEYLVGQSLKVQIAWKNWLIEFAKAGTGNVQFASFGGGEAGRSQALNFNFQSIFIEPYSFHFDTWQILTHSDSLGADGLPYEDMTFFLPGGYTKVPKLVEGQGNYQPYIMVTYQEPIGAAHEKRGDYKIWETGGNASRGATNDVLEKEWHIVSYKGLELYGLQKFLILRKAG